MMFPEPMTASALVLLAGMNGGCDTHNAGIVTKALIRPTKYHFHVKSSDDLHGAVGTASGDWSYETKAEYTQDGSGCIYIKRLDVTIKHQPVIHMVKDYAPGTCGHKHVSGHERAHVNINKNMLKRFSEEVKIDLRNMLRNTRGVQGNQNQLFQKVMARLRTLTDNMVERLDKIHKTQLDNPEEYARVSAKIREKCGP